MKLMTYNIRLGIQHGVERIAEVIDAQGPDIVAIQEVGRHWRMGPPRNTTEELSELTGLEYSDFVATIQQERDEGAPAEYGHAILSRWPIERVARYDFARDVDEPRAACVYSVEAPSGAILILSLHLSHIDAERSKHGPELLKLAAKYLAEDLPLFVLGDLNEDSDKRVWLSELRELMLDAAGSGDATDQSATFPAEDPQDRIDYLMASRGRWERYEVVDEAFASDHRPVVAEWSDEE
jgi:endonuclease/exonuclease/phosphatase family metal-dependent hydrolase